MKVLKFGGTSVGGAEQIRQVTRIVKERAKRGDVIVESAIGKDIYGKEKTKVTDLLIQVFDRAIQGMSYTIVVDKVINRHYSIIDKLGLTKKTIQPEVTELNNVVAKKEKTLAWRDHILSFGERMATKIIAAQLRKEGLGAEAFNAFHLGLITDSNFGNAKPVDNVYATIRRKFRKLRPNGIAVVTGFIGKDLGGNITTLGRGGSDYSASIFAAALGAKSLEIWSDINGIKTADPEIVSNAKTIKKLSYTEGDELALYGAKLHPETIEPAMKKNIPVYILNTFKPQGDHTKIAKRKIRVGGTVKAITCKKGNYLITVNSRKMIGRPGFLAKVFDLYEKYKTSVDLVSTSEANISYTTESPQTLKKIVRKLKLVDNSKVTVYKNRAKVCVVGEGMRHTPGVAGRVFTALGNNMINVEAISQASEVNIGFVVKGEDADNAVKVLHKEYFE